MMLGLGLVGILILAVIVFGLFALVGKLGGAGFKVPPSRGDSAEEILRQRYARGDIDREKFEKRLHELRR